MQSSSTPSTPKNPVLLHSLRNEKGSAKKARDGVEGKDKPKEDESKVHPQLKWGVLRIADWH